MEIEVNPFQQTIPVGTEPITSITVESNLDWLTIPDVVVGANAVLNLNADTATPALKVFGTTAGIGTPSMISLLAGHIPNIEIDQVNGLQDALNSEVSSLISGHAALLALNNGVGDYTITPLFGTTSSTFAIGSDTRFPASVTGLRKGAGPGGADTAAVAKTDYWDTTLVSAGSRGLVPDPVTSTGKFFKDDGTWDTVAGSGTVTDVDLTMPPGVFTVIGGPITTSGTLAVTFASQIKNTFFVGPTTGANAAPTFRQLAYGDLTQAGLVGTASNTVAVGNDTRFPASVTGLRKSSGAGSTDVVAVAGVDYAAAAVFGGKGPSHATGLVPDPGAGSSPFVRYLRDDGLWVTFTPDTATLTNAMLSTMATKTLKANATGSTASPTDVTAIVARSSALLNLESITSHGNSDYTILATDRYVATSANLTAARTWTLPLANSFNAGQSVTISDNFGGINGSFVLKIAIQGGDVIQGSSGDLTLHSKYASVTLFSDGTSKWFVSDMNPSIKRRFFTSNGTYTTPTGAKALLVETIGGGGGGGGALGGSSQASIGGGGGAGGYASALFNAPAASYTMTIGAGGAGGVGAAAGATGGTTDFDSVVISQGGTGGDTLATGTSVTFVAPGSGGVSTSGDVEVAGSSGTHGMRQSGTVALSGSGAAVPLYGPNTSGLFVSSTDGNTAGSGYGSGGGGALAYNATPRTGGTGLQGVIIVTEYY